MREGQPAFLRASRTPAGPLPGVGGPLWRRRALWAGLCAALLAALLGPPVLEPWELASQDARLRASPVPRTPPKLAVIGITPESYERFGAIPELFWGNLRAEAIRRAVGLGARVVGLDLIQIRSADAFLEQLEPRRVPPILGPDGRPDAALAEAIQAARQQGRAVVLGWALGPALRPIPLLTAAGGDLGFVDRGPAPEGEPGGVARHVLLWQPEDGRGLPGFAAALALRQRGEDPADPRALARLEQPFGGGPWPHSMRIHYAGPSSRLGVSRFPTCSLDELLDGRVPPAVREALQDGVALIGLMRDVTDVHRGPGGEYDGIEIHAHALATLLEERPMRRLPPWPEALLTLLAGAGLTGLLHGSRLRLPAAAAGTAALLALGHGLAQALAARGWMLPEVAPGLALVGALVAHQTVRFLEESSARRWAEEVLGRQVDTRVARELLEQEGANRLGGARRPVTVLFTDLRGFTTWADETGDPEQLIPVLACYLEAMALCVEEEEGTLDKFIGDAVMAFWNGPFPQPDHADRALRCALRMREQMAAFNAHVAAQGWLPPGRRLASGVGINTGAAVVGQVGSQHRMNYTVIGSAVNLAARLESATRDLPEPAVCEVLLGDATYQELSTPPPPRRSR